VNPRHRWILGGALLALIAAVVMSWKDQGSSPEEILAAAQAFYESRPIYERPHPYSEVPEGLPDLRAETCGQCHRAIYEEWKISTHARAFRGDAQFLAELHKVSGTFDEHHPDDVSWMCVNCHTPMINQLERLVVGLEDGQVGRPRYVDNPFFDAAMQDDAISCATCHVQDAVIYGPRGDSEAPHPVARGEHLLDESNCVRCHQAQAYFPEQNLACFFTTGEEWERSPAAAQGQTCQDCHMPQTVRKIAEPFDVPERQTRHHWFGGSLIPKHPDFEEEIASLRPLFGSGASLSVVEDPARGPGYWAVRVHNEFAGHRFPTGDPERHVDVTAVITDASGEVLDTVAERIGSEVQWWPRIRLVSDNRIEPGESLYIPIARGEEAGSIGVEIRAEKFRMHQEAFEYHDLEGRYVRGRSFHRSRWVIDGSEARLVAIEDDLGRREQTHR
jgi:hypothetical protein